MMMPSVRALRGHPDTVGREVEQWLSGLDVMRSERGTPLVQLVTGGNNAGDMFVLALAWTRQNKEAVE